MHCADAGGETTSVSRSRRQCLLMRQHLRGESRDLRRERLNLPLLPSRVAQAPSGGCGRRPASPDQVQQLQSKVLRFASRIRPQTVRIHRPRASVADRHRRLAPVHGMPRRPRPWRAGDRETVDRTGVTPRQFTRRSLRPGGFGVGAGGSSHGVMALRVNVIPPTRILMG